MCVYISTYAFVFYIEVRLVPYVTQIHTIVVVISKYSLYKINLKLWLLCILFSSHSGEKKIEEMVAGNSGGRSMDDFPNCKCIFYYIMTQLVICIHVYLSST